MVLACIFFRKLIKESIMDLFNKKKVARLEADLEKARLDLNTRIDVESYDLKERISALEEEMEGYQNYKTEKEILKESDEPWADFEVFMEDDGRVGVKMDWNSHFIKELKRQGINAPSEEDMVSIYFASLVRETGKELSEEEAKKYMK